MKRLLIALAWLPAVLMAQTLDECQQAAEQNYPLISRYDLIRQTTDLTVSNIQKGWLPQVQARAQATLQSDVTAWPDEMQQMMKGMGVDIEGLKKNQYRVGIDVEQTIFDGGAISSRKEVARRQGDVEAARNEVSLYQVRRRVNEMYFALLLLDQQIALNADLQKLLSANEQKLAAMVRRGTAAESDHSAVRAERLGAEQQATALESQRRALTRMLSAFCGIEVSAPQKPVEYVAVLQQQTGQTGLRPELKAIDSQLRLADAQERALRSALIPSLGIFAQGYYGYPGLNMFEDMMHHQWSLNGLIGARLTWNLGALYTHKADKAKIQLQREQAETERDLFLYNNKVEQIRQDENISRYRRQMGADGEIIELRQKVRLAAESKLAHGIIDVNDLVREINQENAARVQQSMHEIEMLKEMYDLKFTTNN